MIKKDQRQTRHLVLFEIEQRCHDACIKLTMDPKSWITKMPADGDDDNKVKLLTYNHETQYLLQSYLDQLQNRKMKRR
jgi:hypothetical protein